MHKFLKLSTTAIILPFIATACVSPKTRQLERHNQALYSTVKAEVNPNPTQKYDIIIDTSNSLDGLVLTHLSFQATSECQLFLKSIPSIVFIHKPLYYKTDLPFKQIGKQKYQATVYKDWLIDKDYFNQGKNCGWQTPNVYYELRPTFDTSPYKFVIRDYYSLKDNQDPNVLFAFNPEYITKPNPKYVKPNEEDTIWAHTSKRTLNELKPNSGLIRITMTKH